MDGDNDPDDDLASAAALAEHADANKKLCFSGRSFEDSDRAQLSATLLIPDRQSRIYSHQPFDRMPDTNEWWLSRRRERIIARGEDLLARPANRLRNDSRRLLGRLRDENREHPGQFCGKLLDLSV